MTPCCKKLSCLCVILGLLSIIGSIGVWYLCQGDTPESIAHAERFGIFVGLWAPTFLGLANYLKAPCECGVEKKTSCCKS